MNKKILCNSYIDKTKCEYKNKCTFAHNLSEQYIYPARKAAYEIIKSKKMLDTDTLDKKILDELRILSLVCDKCINNRCVGGYNCSRGAISPAYQVCYNNLMYKSCNNIRCSSIHLNQQKQKSPPKKDKINISPPESPIIISPPESPEYNKYSNSDIEIDLDLELEEDNPEYLTESIFLI